MPHEEDAHMQRKRAEQTPPLQTQENLLARFELGGDQTNPVNAGAAHDVDGPGNVHEHYIVVAFDKRDRKTTRLNSSHLVISYAVFCLKKKKTLEIQHYNGHDI